MSNDELKKALEAVFAAPEPVKKRAFLRSLPPERASHLGFVLGQAGHIRKSVWAVSLGVLGLALAAGRLVPRDALWLTGALMPFAALTAVAESGRSTQCGMEELELASRFGLKSVTLARMELIGLAHLVLTALLAPAVGPGIVQTGIYLLTPYLFTAALGMAAVRRFRGREGVYMCGGAAVLAAGLIPCLDGRLDAYAPENFRWWALALILCAALAGREYRKTICRTEELLWS